MIGNVGFALVGHCIFFLAVILMFLGCVIVSAEPFMMVDCYLIFDFFRLSHGGFKGVLFLMM